ncbi:glycosyltransferase family 2 protein [Gigaspora margarita]|uniref:Chitin synthase n=1 Tax=Gigaspora margarita TaxID=4874 RepID=A0A8H4EL62_GIGMA|nr:glycosyltransferase family 2 protein [Gigaspora margarita]
MKLFELCCNEKLGNQEIGVVSWLKMVFKDEYGQPPFLLSMYGLKLHCHLGERYSCAFDRDHDISGACGEIKVELGHKCRNLLNPLITSQNFEYKMSNILDKPLESVFGYISVLPGAFSAYRYKALMNGPLDKYLKGETNDSGATKTSIFEANMYLAKDHILSFELVIKKNELWKLKYIKSAKAKIDVPDNVLEFISQRCLWLNGSFFTTFYSISKFTQVWRSGQPFYRKTLLQIQFIYNSIQLIFNWFSLANFYLAFVFLIQFTTSNPTTDLFNGYGDNLFDAARSLYLVIIVIIFICSMGNRPQGTKLIYILCIVLFAIIMPFMLYCSIYIMHLTVYKAVPPLDFSNLLKIQEALKNAAFCDIIISVALTYLLYLFSSFIYCEPWHMLTCLVQYLLLVPSYMNVLMIYAFCNTHDVSWGTKGNNIHIGVQPTKEEKTNDKETKIDVYEEIDMAYINIIDELKNKKHDKKQHRNAVIKKDDYYRFIYILVRAVCIPKYLLLCNLLNMSTTISKNLDVEFPLVLTTAEKHNKKRSSHNYIGKNIKKCDQKRKLRIESERRRRKNEATIIKDIANKLPDLTNIEKIYQN